MNPTFLDNMSWEMAEVYGAISDQIMINLAHYFPFYNAGDPLPKSSFEYQARMLAQMGQVNRDTIRIIRNGLDDADDALQNVLEQSIMDSVKKAEPELLQGVRKGILSPSGIPPTVAPNQMRAFTLYYQQAADKLNLVNTVMLESTKSAYQQAVSDVVADIELADRMNRTFLALDTAAGETITGVSSWNQAMRHAMDKLKNGGITGFIDHAGRHWSAEAYVAMDIRTTVFNTGRAAVWETNENFGNDLYSVSYHNGARPLCYDWQNKVISSTDNARTVVDLDGNEIRVYAQSETSYGQAAGLFGINCKHYPTPFIPGVSVIDGKPQNPEENERTYAESQEQRRLERKLREEKRDVLMAKAQGAPPDEIRKLEEKARQSSADIDEFCTKTGRTRHRDREAVYTKREFPEKDKYDVGQFEREQQKLINDYFGAGGAQQNYTFGQMTPNEPIVPRTSNVPITPPNVASQATTQGYTTDMFKNVKGVDDDFKEGMAKALLASKNTDAINIFGKYADELNCYDPTGKQGTFFRGWGSTPGVSMKLSSVVKGSTYEKPFEVAFHEFGHMVDWLINGKNGWQYASNVPVNGMRLQDVIKNDFKVFKKSIGAKNVREVVSKLKAEKMDAYASGNISDILEKCTGISYPLGTGHGKGYHSRDGATEREFFAEVLDSSVTNPGSYEQMMRLFPNAVNMVWEIVRGAL